MNDSGKMVRIKHLADRYFPLERGASIGRHQDLLRIADLRGSRFLIHPHRGYRVYLSRRALKHFVEERKETFLVNHSKQEAVVAIHFAIDMIPDAFMDFDRYEYEPKAKPPKHFYSKDYSPIGWPSLRILVEQKGRTLEIRSIHFKKHDRRRPS